MTIGDELFILFMTIYYIINVINGMDNAMKDINKELPEKRSISLLTIIEIIVLAIGVAMSFSSTVKPLKYTARYAWCFIFPLLGVGLIAFLIVKIRKKMIWLIGLGFIIMYLITAGYGAFVCELNNSRLKRISGFTGKEVIAVQGDTEYIWDGESASYNPEKLEYMKQDERGMLKVTVDGEEAHYGVLTSSDDDCLYLEIYGGGTGIFLKLSPK